MPALLSRANREIKTVPGFGGYLLPIQWDRDMLSAPLNMYDGPFLELGKWRLRHIHILVEDTHSGCNGALHYSLVAQDFNFDGEIPWNARIAASRPRESVGFMEEILVGYQSTDFNIAVLFALGDRTRYDMAALGGMDKRAAYFAPQVLLKQVETITDATGKDIIRMNIQAQGNSLLHGLRGQSIMFNRHVLPAEEPIL